MQIFFTVLVTLASVWLVNSLIMSLLYPLYAKNLGLIAPAQRAWALRLIALTPALLSVLACMELFAVPGEIVPFHCHLSNCAAHNPDTPPSFAILTGILLCAFVPVVLLALNMLWRTATLAKQWRRWSTAAGEYRYLNIPQAIACTLGLLRPTIYFSRGFIAELSPLALNVVIAHEQAHAVRYDNFWAALVRIFSLGWIDRQHLADDLELAQEQACDQRAALVVGDAVVVAETLLLCQRLAQVPPVVHLPPMVHLPKAACAFLRGQLAARVRGLFEQQYSSLSALALLRFGSLALLLMAALVIPLHYLMEIL